MKCEIIIKGQTGGNFKLLRKMRNRTGKIELFFGRTMFLQYNTLKEARNDLKEAYKELVDEEPDFAEHGISFNGNSLCYDASEAKLIRK